MTPGGRRRAGNIECRDRHIVGPRQRHRHFGGAARYIGPGNGHQNAKGALGRLFQVHATTDHHGKRTREGGGDARRLIGKA